MAGGKFLKRNVDLAANLSLVLTVVLFVVALFEKGLTHDILLEAAVFLVSIKLVLSTIQIQQTLKALQEKVDRLK